MASSGAYDPITFCDPSLDPGRDIHSGPLPRIEDTRGHAIVYIATCLFPPSDSYVGITEKGLGTRKTQHLWRANNGSKLRFHRALIKYGPENFFWHVLEVWPDYWSALEAERKIIRILSPAYNLTSGGGGVKGFRHSDASKSKMSAAKIGKPSTWSKISMPQSIRDRLAEARMLETGKVRSPKARAAMTANSRLANAARRRAVICVNTGVEYESCAAAGSALGVSPGQVSNSCHKGATLRPSKLKFRYRVEK